MAANGSKKYDLCFEAKKSSVTKELIRSMVLGSNGDEAEGSDPRRGLGSREPDWDRENKT